MTVTIGRRELLAALGGAAAAGPLAARARWWCGGSGAWMPQFFEAQEYQAIAAVRPPSLNCSETRRRDHARVGRRSDTQRRARLAKPGTRRNRFCFGRCYAALSLRARPNMAAVKSPVLTRNRTCGGGHSVIDGKEICC